jgi:predicted RNase H-like HicB family nuclease
MLFFHILKIAEKHKIGKKKVFDLLIIKKSGEWWIGWLIDLPGVNAQEKTKEELIESLRIGAEDMLATDVPFESDARMVTVDIPEPVWKTVL